MTRRGLRPLFPPKSRVAPGQAGARPWREPRRPLPLREIGRGRRSPSEPPEDPFTSKLALERVDHLVRALRVARALLGRLPASGNPESLDRAVRPGSVRAAALRAQARRGGGSRSGPSRLRRTHRECSSRALRNAPDCWSSPRVLTWGREVKSARRSSTACGRRASPATSRSPRARAPRTRVGFGPGGRTGTEGGEARPKVVRSPRLGVNAPRSADADRREQGRRDRPERRIKNWT